MKPWQRLKCSLFGLCDVSTPETRIQPIIDLMEEGLAETRGIRMELQRLREHESGIWPQDLINGRYGPHHPNHPASRRFPRRER